MKTETIARLYKTVANIGLGKEGVRMCFTLGEAMSEAILNRGNDETERYIDIRIQAVKSILRLQKLNGGIRKFVRY